MSDIKYFTKEGLENLKDELNHLKTEERPNITKEIAEARDKGDLSENAEYDAAKEFMLNNKDEFLTEIDG